MTYFESWVKSMENIKKADNSVLGYSTDVKKFLIHLFGNTENMGKEQYEEIGSEDAFEYMNEMEFEDSTKNRKNVAYHLFWSYLKEKGITDINKLEHIKLIKLEEPIPDPFTPEEVAEIYNSIENSMNKRCYDRDVAIMYILLSIPVRKNEIMKLLKTDYTDRGTLIFRNRKGKKSTTVGCSRKIIVAIDRYLATRTDNSKYLFVTEDGQNPVGVKSFDNLVLKYANCNPHKLRGTAATMMYKSGVPLERIEVIGGWQKNSITLKQNYIRIDEDDLRNDLEGTEKFVMSKISNLQD